jgi:hypothetical protein
MFKLSDEQIEFILNDIKQRGVKLESLQDSLLDHICCLLERDEETEKNFEGTYESTVRRFFKKELKEIEEETEQLLKNKYYYKVKTILYILLFVSLGCNVLLISKNIIQNYQQKQEALEIGPIDNITLKEGTNYLIEKMKKEYPGVSVKNKIYVTFYWAQEPMPFMLSSDSSRAESMGLSVDSLKKLDKHRQAQIFHDLDSLAAKYKNTTVVAAFQRSSGHVQDIINEYKTKNKNTIYLGDMNKLNSGYFNNKQKKDSKMMIRLTPTQFLLNSNGELLYVPEDKWYWKDEYDPKLIALIK